jgi:hypothetical protein
VERRECWAKSDANTELRGAEERDHQPGRWGPFRYPLTPFSPLPLDGVDP